MNEEQNIKEAKKRLSDIKKLATDGMMNPEIAAQKLCEAMVCLIDGIQWFITKAEDDDA